MLKAMAATWSASVAAMIHSGTGAVIGPPSSTIIDIAAATASVVRPRARQWPSAATSVSNQSVPMSA